MHTVICPTGLPFERRMEHSPGDPIGCWRAHRISSLDWTRVGISFMRSVTHSQGTCMSRVSFPKGMDK